MHIYKWGGKCPDNLYFDSYSYKNGRCERWQYRFFQSWYNHGKKNYVSKEFLDFSVAYNWLINEYPLFDQFVEHCGDSYGWSWEKDGSGSHLFDRGMQFIPAGMNCIQRELDNSDLGSRRLAQAMSPESRDKVAHSEGRPVVCIDPDGIVYEFWGAKEAKRELGIPNSTIGQRCNGDHNGFHTVVYGRWRGWSFYWKDEYEGGTY